VNGVSKYREMYDDQVTLPLVIRTPMGGRRGYGPTPSQSLEKFLMGVPTITVVATSECHDLEALMTEAIESDEPVVLIENKVMYGRPERRPVDGWLDGLRVVETPGPLPTLSLSGSDFEESAATIWTYGGMLPIVLEAVTTLIVEEEIFCEVVAPSRLLPVDLDPLLASVARTGALVTAEEGSLTGGIGAEVAARVQERAFAELAHPIRRVAAEDGIIPSAPGLEAARLPGVQDVVDAVLAIVAEPAAPRGRTRA
jgi:pyruvate/2-oxoglutarate/acetoin dehydrogenase E1 component